MPISLDEQVVRYLSQRNYSLATRAFDLMLLMMKHEQLALASLVGTLEKLVCGLEEAGYLQKAEGYCQSALALLKSAEQEASSCRVLLARIKERLAKTRGQSRVWQSKADDKMSINDVYHILQTTHHPNFVLATETNNMALFRSTAEEMTRLEAEALYPLVLNLWREWETKEVLIKKMGKRFLLLLNKELAWKIWFRFFRAKLVATKKADEDAFRALQTILDSSYDPLSHESMVSEPDWKRYQAMLFSARTLFDQSHLSITEKQIAYSDACAALLVVIIQDSVDLLSRLPGRYSFISTGSLAKKQMTPYSDVEFVLLLDEEAFENKAIYKLLMDLIHFKIDSLAEASRPGFRLDISLTGLYEGCADAIFSNSFKNRGSDGAAPVSLAYARHLKGELSLFSLFEKCRMEHLLQEISFDNKVLIHHQAFALAQMKAHQDEFKDSMVGWDSGRGFLKDLFFGPLQYAVLDLAIYHCIVGVTVLEALEELEKKGVLSQVIVKTMERALSFVQALRIKVQMRNKAQIETVFRQSSARQEGYRLSIDDEAQLNLISMGLLQPLYRALERFQEARSLTENPVLDEIKKESASQSDISSNVDAMLSYFILTEADYEVYAGYYRELSLEARHLFRAKLQAKPSALFQGGKKTRLLSFLDDYPNPQGHRYANDMARVRWEATLRTGLFGDKKSPSPKSVKAELKIGDSRYEGYLFEEIQSQLFLETGEINLANKVFDGRRPTLMIRNKRGEIIAYAKFSPEAPGVQFLVDQLYGRISGQHMQTTLCKLVLPDGRFYAVLFSEPVPGETLADYLRKSITLSEIEQRIDGYFFTLNVIERVLLYLEDEKIDNLAAILALSYSGEKRYRFLGVDNDRICSNAIQTILKGPFFSRQEKVDLKTVIFFMSSMYSELNDQAVALFLTLDPYTLLKEWLTELEKYNRIYWGTKDRPGIFSAKESTLLAKQKDSCRIPINFSHADVIKIYERWRILRQLFKNERVMLSEPMALLRRMEFRLAQHCAESFDCPEDQDAHSRFNAFCAKWTNYREVVNERTHMVTHISTPQLNNVDQARSLQTLEAQKKKYDKEIELRMIYSPADIYRCELFPFHHYYQKINSYVSDLMGGNTDTFLSPALTHAHHLRQSIVNRLAFEGMPLALQVTLLSAIEKAHINFRLLRLTHCEMLTERRLVGILEHSVALQVLDIRHTSVTRLHNKEQLTELVYLNAEDCLQLTSIDIEAHRLKALFIAGSSALIRVVTRSMVLEKLDISRCVCLTDLAFSAIADPKSSSTLVTLTADGCIGLREIGMPLPSLQYLSLDSCSNLVSIRDDMPKLKFLNLDYTQITLSSVGGDSSSVLQLLAEKELDQGAIDIKGNTAIHRLVSLLTACPERVEKVIRQIILRKSVDLNRKNQNNDTPLMLAVKLKQWRVALFLFHQMDAEILDDENTWLHLAAAAGDIFEIEKALQSGWDIDARNKENQSAIALAYEQQQINSVKHLLLKGAKLGNINILHMAAWIGDLKLLITALEQKIDINTVNDRGQTALQIAYDANERVIALVLRRNGALPIKEKSGDEVNDSDVSLNADEENKTNRITKMVFFGGAFGKTAICTHFTQSRFLYDSRLTMGVDIFSYNVEYPSLHLQIWDSAGRPSYSIMTKQYLVGASLAFLGFDLTNKRSFDGQNSALFWFGELSKHAPKIPILLVGNKSDLKDQRAISYGEVSRFAKLLGINGYLECSAKTGEGIKEIFEVAKEWSLCILDGEPITSPTLNLEERRLQKKWLANSHELVMDDEEPEVGGAVRVEQSGHPAVEPFVEAASSDVADAGQPRPSANGGQDRAETEGEREARMMSRFLFRRPMLCLGSVRNPIKIVILGRQAFWGKGLIHEFTDFIRDSRIYLAIWPAASSERFAPVVSRYIRGASFVFLCFDLTNKLSLDGENSALFWFGELKKHAPKIPILLVGNNSDLEDKRAVSYEEAFQFAQCSGINGYLECSAEKGGGIEMITRVAEQWSLCILDGKPITSLTLDLEERWLREKWLAKRSMPVASAAASSSSLFSSVEEKEATQYKLFTYSP